MKGQSYVNQRGFTLLEILLGLFIVALMVGLVSFSLPDNGSKHLQSVAKRLHASLLLAREQAVFQSRDYGLRATARSYQFFRFEDGQWIIASETHLQAVQLPSDISIQLLIEEQLIEPSQTEEPPLLLLSDGQVSDFQIDLIPKKLIIPSEHGSKTISVRGKYHDQIRIETIEPASSSEDPINSEPKLAKAI